MGKPEPGVAFLHGHPADRKDEGELVESAKRGVRSAKGELFRRHAPRLTAMLTRLLASTAEAQDAAQDTFVDAFRDLDQLHDVATFGGWLTRIAVHQAHRRFRRRRLLSLLGLDRTVEDAALDQLADLRAPLDVIADLAALARVIDALPALERIAWMLRHVEGYRLVDVARSCDCSLATAKRRIQAAHEKIRDALDVPEASDE